ncbi:hypothetical protein E2562_001836 [Oryza meyeriana var. granulata]|uniref:Uncharacterized protein n=1 Tax=Oryza meyeriana var. granulata TaxID=110450 RepID=A0A6G1CDE3_9ORYZ|nr:hypothetical protein E2562_001836 [Oryza meyeriana var. granulata]
MAGDGHGEASGGRRVSSRSSFTHVLPSSPFYWSRAATRRRRRPRAGPPDLAGGSQEGRRATAGGGQEGNEG